jgi:TRAP-type C4-dicarboxylate transport system permease small subunit
MQPLGQIWRAGADLSPLQRALLRLSTLSAALGGAIIFAASLTVTLSVVMRATGIGGIRGDFELVELVSAACASLFLPLCQLRRGHVLVDLFTNWLPLSVRHRLDNI